MNSITNRVKNAMNEMYTDRLWDQLRVDMGKEWVLMLFIQEQLADLRRNIHRAPHLQTTSKQIIHRNHFTLVLVLCSYQ